LSPEVDYWIGWLRRADHGKMVGKPIRQQDLDELNKHVTRRKRMKAAHEKGRHWKGCVYCVRLQNVRQ
jgi:hypothetical protein